MKINKTTDNFVPKYCKKTVSGNITEFMEMSCSPSAPPVRKLSQSQYVNINSGEVCDYNRSSSRSDNTDSLRYTFKHIRGLINTNCTIPQNLHWVTLTYADNMTDTKTVYKDFDSFRKRFYRYCDKIGRKRPEYIAVLEPQARGAWHIHLILIWDNKRPFIDNNSTFAPMWGHGYTKIQACPNSDNLGAYLSAYLGDVPITEYSGDVTKAQIKTVKGKRYIKGGRLSLYPVGTNIVRHSRGIKQPVSEVVDCDDLEKEKASSGKLTFSRSLVVSSDDSSMSGGSGKSPDIYIRHSYYNSKRKKSQAEKLIEKALALGLVVETDNPPVSSASDN